jgi:hypothetical protein
MLIIEIFNKLKIQTKLKKQLKIIKNKKLIHKKKIMEKKKKKEWEWEGTDREPHHDRWITIVRLIGLLVTSLPI